MHQSASDQQATRTPRPSDLRKTDRDDAALIAVVRGHGQSSPCTARGLIAPRDSLAEDKLLAAARRRERSQKIGADAA